MVTKVEKTTKVVSASSRGGDDEGENESDD